jgi:hypothetical protein
MDARLCRLIAVVPALLLLGTSSSGATFSTRNFAVTAPTPDFAQEVAQTAERCRAELAQVWLGHTLPDWFRPCQVSVTAGQIGAGGATTFTFAAGQVFGWNMKVQGTPERILDSVIPHEVSHTIFATHFRRPLPRWADEGAATLVEHESERHRQQLLLHQVFNSPQRIPLTRLISMKEYPSDMQSVLTLYAEGYSLASYLVQSRGRDVYLRFLEDGYQHDWDHAIQTCYLLPNVAALEQRWTSWVMAGSPELPDGQMIAQNEANRQKNRVIRSQSPDGPGVGESRGQTAQAARPTRPILRGASLSAPAPAARNSSAARTAERETAEVAMNDSSRRPRESRARLLNEGWHPVLIERNAPARSLRNSDRDSASAATRADESPARRRFRDAKSQQDQADESAAVEQNAPTEQGAPTASDVAAARSDFHPEN